MRSHSVRGSLRLHLAALQDVLEIPCKGKISTLQTFPNITSVGREVRVQSRPVSTIRDLRVEFGNSFTAYIFVTQIGTRITCNSVIDNLLPRKTKQELILESSPVVYAEDGNRQVATERCEGNTRRLPEGAEDEQCGDAH